MSNFDLVAPLPFPLDVRLFQTIDPLQLTPTALEVALAPIEAQSFRQHVGILYRTPPDFYPHA